MVYNMAAIPVSGSVTVVLIYRFEIAEFVVRALPLKH
ncbi:hypothetical protein CORC01_00996 [Colletotrichum orchidophilum]|uniref:Uncharacterized protein n=1 Tax=Colletotrichum orchidophilum TaxID=1209926 RepID=A0A1G4BQW3_9PEZI|nr:uncharacterized protein CORC01_00996 [Colletotrichum orchidophilum]OHF03677.1 hypothetical protein CORC01_00996 [Colletotrichum orchidophilum]